MRFVLSMLALALVSFLGGTYAAMIVGIWHPMDEGAFGDLAWSICGVLFLFGLWVRLVPRHHRGWTVPLTRTVRAVWDPAWYRLRVTFWFCIWLIQILVGTYRAAKAALLLCAGFVYGFADELGVPHAVALALSLMAGTTLAALVIRDGYRLLTARAWHRPAPPVPHDRAQD